MNTTTMPHPTVPSVETHRVTGDKLLARVRQLIHQGNVQRLIVKNEDGVTLMEFPLTVGVVGAVLLPVWVALGAIAAVAAHYHLVVEKRDEAAPARPADAAADAPERTSYSFVCRPDV